MNRCGILDHAASPKCPLRSAPFVAFPLGFDCRGVPAARSRRHAPLRALNGNSRCRQRKPGFSFTARQSGRMETFSSLTIIVCGRVDRSTLDKYQGAGASAIVRVGVRARVVRVHVAEPRVAGVVVVAAATREPQKQCAEGECPITERSPYDLPCGLPSLRSETDLIQPPSSLPISRIFSLQAS